MLELFNRHLSRLAFLPFIYGLAACSSSPEKLSSNTNQDVKVTNAKISGVKSVKQTEQQAMQPDDLLYAILRGEYSYWVGAPYRWGGNSLQGIDCSSLVQQVFQNSFNIPLPRTTEHQVKKGYSIKKSQLQVGDLVFFKTSRTTRHVGIYMGNDEFFHVSTSQGTKISSLSNVYWKKHYWQSRRVIQ